MESYSAYKPFHTLSKFLMLLGPFFLLSSSTNGRKEIVKNESGIFNCPVTRTLIRKLLFDVELSTLIIASSSLAPEIVSSVEKKKSQPKNQKKRASLQVNKCLVASGNGRGAPNCMRNCEVNKSETLTSQGRVWRREGKSVLGEERKYREHVFAIKCLDSNQKYNVCGE